MLDLMYGYIFIKFLKLVFYAVIAICVIMTVRAIYRYAKASYVLRHIDDVEKLDISPPVQTYREVSERSGYSIGDYGSTTHYRIKRVPHIKIWKAKAYFKDGRCIKFMIKENSVIYNKIKKGI